MTATPRRRRSFWRFVLPGLAIATVATSVATAQDKGTVDPKPLPPLANPDDPKTPAKELFGRRATAAPLAGALHRLLRQGLPRRRRRDADQRQDLAGDAAVAQPQLGPSGPRRLPRTARARRAPKVGWRGLLVGDISQARGGPMLTGHASHQVGLDADIWLTPMPDARADARRSARRCRRPWWSRRTARTSIRTSGRRRMPRSSRRRRRTRRSSASSSTPRSRRRCAADRHRPRLAAQGAADVGPRLSLPHPHALPGRTAPTAGRRIAVPRRRRLRQGARLVVPRRDHQAQAGAASRRSTPEAKPKPKPQTGMTMADLPPACRQVLLAPLSQRSARAPTAASACRTATSNTSAQQHGNAAACSIGQRPLARHQHQQRQPRATSDRTP